MTITSLGFILFVAVVFIVYSIISENKKWIVLLAASVIFYASVSIKAFAYITFTSVVSFYAALAMQNAENKKERKNIAAASIFCCFAVLVVLKYSNFVLINVSSLIKLFSPQFVFKPIKYFIPMGLSFYTFSVTSYLFDIYHKKYQAEKSLPRYVLFVSWFPSIIQGPINRYDLVNKDFFSKPHSFSLEQSEFAVQRILWGMLKKLVIADNAAPAVTYVFENYKELPHYIIFAGLLFYSIQLYADFSGGMDIALGVSDLFGIRLSENFRQPYFSQSIAEFWRRWHITLGAWMKDYVFYPFALSKTSQKIIKFLKPRSPYLSKVIPMCIGNILVFLLVGIWHGAEWHYVVYGLFHGGIIAASILLKPAYDKGFSLFHINAHSKPWQFFRIIRTFYLINIGCLFDEVTGLTQSIGMTKQLFTFTNGNLIKNFHFHDEFNIMSVSTVLFFSLVWIVISIVKEKGIDVRQKIASFALPVRWIIYLALVICVPFFQAETAGSFMYAQF